MAEQTFQPGDIVVLKSGSPKMTVEYSNDDDTKCWYINTQTKEIEFKEIPTAVLKKAAEKSSAQDDYELFDDV